MRRGLLLTMTQPPDGMEAEFNAWYDEEHLPERLAIPGFRSARRWLLDKTYLATYELDTPEVLTSPAYLSSFEKPTAWTRRCLGKCVVFKRWACEQLGDADPHPAAQALLMSFDRDFKSEALQTRRFATASGELILLHELANPAPNAYALYQP